MTTMKFNDWVLMFAENGWWVRFENQQIVTVKKGKEQYFLYRTFGIDEINMIAPGKGQDRLADPRPISEVTAFIKGNLVVKNFLF